MRYKITKKDRWYYVFALLTLAIAALGIYFYINNLTYALAMDKNSYECTEDSMMSMICNDPYGSSITWTLLDVTVVAWPLIAAWLTGLMLVLDSVISKKKSPHSSS